MAQNKLARMVGIPAAVRATLADAAEDTAELEKIARLRDRVKRRRRARLLRATDAAPAVPNEVIAEAVRMPLGTMTAELQQARRDAGVPARRGRPRKEVPAAK